MHQYCTVRMIGKGNSLVNGYIQPEGNNYQ